MSFVKIKSKTIAGNVIVARLSFEAGDFVCSLFIQIASRSFEHFLVSWLTNSIKLRKRTLNSLTIMVMC